MKSAFSFQLADGSPRDAAEQIVELDYQSRGYIVSTNKQISINKYIDILAVKDETVHLVSVSTNLKDKTVDGTEEYFKQVIEFLESREELRWLVGKKIIKVLAAFEYDKNEGKIQEQRERYKQRGIDILFFEEIFNRFRLKC